MSTQSNHAEFSFFWLAAAFTPTLDSQFFAFTAARAALLLPSGAMHYSYSEQEYLWAQEVLYLHSLWHRGPPRSTSPYAPHPIHHDHHHHHPALHPTPSYPNPNPSLCNAPERGTKRQRQEPPQGKEWPCDPAAVVPEESPPDVWPRFEQAAQNPALSPNSVARGKLISTQRSAIQACRGFFSRDLDPESDCDLGTENVDDTLPRRTKKQKQESSQDKEWPCDPISVPEQSSPHTWPSFEQAVQNPTASPSSAAQNTLLPMQLSAIQSCKGFFAQDSGSESEFESGSESDVDEFFMGLLENAVSLRGCYEKNSENGEFYCLVCEARKDGNKGKGRLYRGCAALVQHASTIQKVGWRVAHRAFARSICWVLGWDPQRLPSIVLLLGSLAKADHLEDKQETVAIQIPNSTSDSPEIQKRDTNDGPPSSIIEQETTNIPGSDACSPQVLPLHAGNEAVDYASDKQEHTSMTSEDAINHVNSGSPVEGKEEDTSIDA